MKPVPYYSQWESPTLAADIIEGRCALADDPQWAASGAVSPQEYAYWANHICGMACLKMILAARSGEVHATLHLARMAMNYGAYTLQGGAIRGLIYAPFVAMVGKEFGIEAEVKTNVSTYAVPNILEEDSFFLASVHPFIRWPARSPPHKGGHLVLVTRSDARGLLFHNPSGHDNLSQRDVLLDMEIFDRFFAGRGIRVSPAVV